MASLPVIPSCFLGQALSQNKSSPVILSAAKDLNLVDVITTHRLIILLLRLDSSLHYVSLRTTIWGISHSLILELFTAFKDRLREGMTI